VWLLLGCGSSGSTDLFDGVGGTRASMPASTAGAAPVSTGANGTCSPAKDFTGGSSGPFNTADAVCARVTGAISGWGCSNFDGRVVKVNGKTVTCGELPLPDALGGAYYFDISAGMFDYASFYWF